MENQDQGELFHVITKGACNTEQKGASMSDAYLELGNNFIFGHIHEVHVFHCKGRERDNGKKSSINLLRCWCSWQHGEQNRLNEKQRGGLNLGSMNRWIQYLETMTLAPRNIWMSLLIFSRAFSYQYNPCRGTSPAQPMIPVPYGRGQGQGGHSAAWTPCWELLVSLPWGPFVDFAVFQTCRGRITDYSVSRPGCPGCEDKDRGAHTYIQRASTEKCLTSVEHAWVIQNPCEGVNTKRPHEPLGKMVDKRITVVLELGLLSGTML